MKFDVPVNGSRRVSGMRLFKQALAPPYSVARSRFVRDLFSRSSIVVGHVSRSSGQWL